MRACVLKYIHMQLLMIFKMTIVILHCSPYCVHSSTIATYVCSYFNSILSYIHGSYVYSHVAMYAINIDNLESTSQSLQGSSAHTQLQLATRTTGSKLRKVL